MSRTELRSIVDRCKPADQRYLLAYLRTKDPEFRRKISTADRELETGPKVRLRSTRRGLVRVAS